LIDAAGAFANQTIAPDVDLAMSFHTTKTLPCGEGGALVTTDKAIAERLRTASNFGIDRHDGYVKGIGFNTKMSEVHAAYGLASLAEFPKQAAARITLHQQYLASCNADLGVTQQRSDQGVYSIFNLALSVEAAAVQGRMAEHGIECRRWYCPPLPQHPFFMDCPRAGKLDVAYHLGERILGLPFHLEMDEQSVATVLEALHASL
jgi:dTDP-4-amino-4,6-dideoxygalactose transaminase